jgi:hypothetical protein
MNRSNGRLAVARAQALFTSDLPIHSQPSRTEVTDVIRRAMHTHGGVQACACEVAAAYGEHPEVAAPRMRWALTVVDSVYAPVSHPARRAIAVAHPPRVVGRRGRNAGPRSTSRTALA